MNGKHVSHLFGTKADAEAMLRAEIDRLKGALLNRDIDLRHARRVNDQLREALALKEREVDALSKALNGTSTFRPTHRHVKRGTEYCEVARGKLQTDVPLTDYSDLVAYRDADDTWWFRSPVEFDDGRFEALE